MLLILELIISISNLHLSLRSEQSSKQTDKKSNSHDINCKSVFVHKLSEDPTELLPLSVAFAGKPKPLPWTLDEIGASNFARDLSMASITIERQVPIAILRLPKYVSIKKIL